LLIRVFLLFLLLHPFSKGEAKKNEHTLSLLKNSITIIIFFYYKVYLNFILMLIKNHILPLETIPHPLFHEKQISLKVLRTDKTHPVISGNKWFKLKYNLIEAQKKGFKTLLSFGGPYSNHLHALATAGKANHFNTIGIVRGEEHLPLNPTLSDISREGMKLYYVNRRTYRNKHLPEVIEQFRQLVGDDDPFSEGKSAGDFYLVPEGGTNKLAILGASEITNDIPDDTDFVCVPCGTGGTMAGIISGLSEKKQIRTKVLGFPAMKGGQFLNETIRTLLNEKKTSSQQVDWELFYDWSFGGFGKMNKSLAQFMYNFEKKYSIELDPVYTAKMMYGIVSMVKNNFFPIGSKVIVIHTGGLQGRRGMEQQIKRLLTED